MGIAEFIQPLRGCRLLTKLLKNIIIIRQRFLILLEAGFMAGLITKNGDAVFCPGYTDPEFIDQLYHYLFLPLII
jgi:hypothetical protein